MSFSDFSEQEYKQSTKTDEELRRLTLEEDLGETKRSFQILTKGQHLQKSAIYSRLHRILAEPDAIAILLPIINEDIQNQDEELQIEAAQSLVKAVEAKFMNQEQMRGVFGLTLTMLKIWSQPVLDAWVLVFRELAMILPFNIIEDEINKIILYLSDSSQPAVSRYIAGRMIGFISDVRKDKIKGTLFERSRVLCQDHDIEVRKILAKEVMFKLCSRMSSDLIEMHIFDKIMQLTYDSEINVRCCGIELLFNIAPLLSPEEQRTRICKIFLELLSSPKEEVQIKVSSMIGQIYHTLHPHLSKNNAAVLQVLQAFKEFGCHKNTKIRVNFAHHIPAILALTDTRVSFEKLKKVYINLLLKDESKDVRYKLVSSFHEVTGLLAPEDAMKYALNAFKEILKDGDQAIIARIVTNCHVIVRNLVKADAAIKAIAAEEAAAASTTSTTAGEITEEAAVSKQQQQVLTLSYTNRIGVEDTLMNALLQFANEQNTKHQWRIKAELLSNLSKCLDVFNMSTFAKSFLPKILSSSMVNESDEVRHEAAGVIIKFITSNKYTAKSKEVICDVIASFFRSTSYQQRISFIYFVEHATLAFSRKFFKKHGLFCVLDLSADKVKSVRLRLAKAMPKLRYMLDFDDEDSEYNTTSRGGNEHSSSGSSSTMGGSSKMIIDDEIDRFDKALSKLSNQKDLLAAERAQKEIMLIDFDNPEVSKRIIEVDLERQRNEERLIDLERKEREEANKQPEKDDFDYFYKNDSIGSNQNYINNYKKRYSVRYTTSSSSNGISGSGSGNSSSNSSSTSSTKQKPPSHNTNSLTSLNKSAASSGVNNQSSQSSSSTSSNSHHSTQLPSIYNSSSLKPSNPTKKITKGNSVEQKPSTTSTKHQSPPPIGKASSSILPSSSSSHSGSKPGTFIGGNGHSSISSADSSKPSPGLMKNASMGGVGTVKKKM